MDKRLIFETLIGLAKCHYKASKINEKEKHLKEAFSLFNDLIVYISDEFQKNYEPSVVCRNFNKKQKEVYNLAIKIAFELYQQKKDKKYAEAILLFIEKSKSTSLRHQNFKHLEERYKVNQDYLQEEQQKESEIANLELMLLSTYLESDTKNKESKLLRRERKRLVKELQVIKKKIAKKYKEYAAVRYNTKLISIDKVKRNLKSDSAILTYYITENHVYIAAISHKEVKIERKEIERNVLDKDLKAFINSISTGTLSKFKDKGFKLFNTLIEPVYDLLKNKSKWVIIPDDELYNFPFDGLITHSAEDAEKFKELPYLIRNHTLIGHYSINLFFSRIGFNKQGYRKGDVHAMYAPILFNKESNLPDLLFSKEEIENVAKYLKQSGQSNITKYLNKNATDKNFLESLINAYMVLISTHSLKNKENGEVQLLLKDINGNIIYVNRKQILESIVNSKFVILSGCNTGDGTVQTSEAKASLVRAFFYSGVETIIYTSINVYNEDAAILIPAFFENLLIHKMGRAKALQQAKIKMIERSEHSEPINWIGFQMHSNWKKRLTKSS